ncbi:PadR family transcriptional regulator [Methylocystis suflitae]|uniref:PadR family transcriptional regulator n=1 Tax=Methylocystis suflitae TaxID=2951405 RepID=UPI00210C3508|nr:helix-turn-helix transcriptional regulator [Methylocystis suflitae]MCQ4188493.1 PadR family transcriptional regulator [Methylocystis suflitae]
MSKIPELTTAEQQTLLAIIIQHPNAYGVSIRDEIRKRTDREYSFGSIYAVLERLEDKGLIASREGEATAARGGRKKQYFAITGPGQLALQASLRALDAMRDGLEIEGASA